jgi:predicted tellurium resistance membrane protein TerC
MHWISDPGLWASFVTLSALEIVLGVDNVVFISLVAMKLPKAKRFTARLVGLGGALVMRVAFLASVVWLAGLREPFAYLGSFGVSWHDVIMLSGGLFLLYKATIEIHDMIEGVDAEGGGPKGKGELIGVIFQIIMLDLVFSIDSVMTAVGMTQNLPVMIAAIFVAILIMLFASGALGRFIEAHPTTKMLALAFLILIGTTLVADAAHHHFDRTYLYVAIGFSTFVEILNVIVHERSDRRRRQGAPVSSAEAPKPAPHAAAFK